MEMNHHQFKLIVFILTGFICITANAQDKFPQLGKSSLTEVIHAMTLEEKTKLVVGNGFRMPGAPPQGPVIGQTQDKVPGAAGTTFGIPRLGIPSIVVADGPAGLRISPFRNKDSSKTYYATAWPVATLLASSWDTALIKEVGKGFGNEVLEYGVDIILGPALNIHRNPLGGRNFEYYSEDPLIAGSMTAAIVNGIESNGVGTSIKHFAANNQETNRNTVNTIVSQRALREIYLKGFEIAVKKSQPWTVMSSYNKINGIYTSESHDLLTTLLRKEWGFKGFVMTDWFGGKDPVAQMQAGNELIMPGTPQQSQRIFEAVQHDSLDIKVLDENVLKILTIILETPAFKKYAFSNQPDLKSHAALSRRAASEGMILLKNDKQVLPFKQGIGVALFGNTSYDIIAGGTGSGDVNKAYTISMEQGLVNAGYRLDENLRSTYKIYIADAKAKRPKPRGFFDSPKPITELLMDPAACKLTADQSDMALITIGRNAGEGSDRKIENDFNLSDTERLLVKGVAEAFHAKGKKVLVVLNIGGVIETISWRDMVDGILLAWQPGLEAGNAIADILSGKVNPSGRLSTTFPVKYNDDISSKNFPGKEFPEQAVAGSFGRRQVPAEVTYEEGVYVGYRYYNTFHIPTAYEFGYGLSYTKFDYSNLRLSTEDFTNKLTATVTITNTGKVAGKEVVQLYISAPTKKIDKPAAELRAFAKTKELAPGKSETLTFMITAENLASFHTGNNAWVAEAGSYKLMMGASSTVIKQSAAFRLSKDMVVEKTNPVLLPQLPIQELKQ
jgi:beta-glucosidase